MSRVDLAVPFAQRLVAPGSEGARLDVFYPASVRLLKRLDMYGQIEDRWSRVPQRDISMALLSDGPVTFRTMIRQAAVAFAQDGILRSGNASLSHDCDDAC